MSCRQCGEGWQRVPPLEDTVDRILLAAAIQTADRRVMYLPFGMHMAQFAETAQDDLALDLDVSVANKFPCGI
jgi:hypothetical protein